MFDQILFPTDGSEGADVALDHVLEVAAANQSTVHFLNVVDTPRYRVGRVGEEAIDGLEDGGQEIVTRAAARARDRGLDTVTDVRRGEPHRTVIDYAAGRNIDQIAMPTHGRRGLERFLLGSTTERVVRRSDVPVLTIRPTDDRRLRYPYRDVLVATDGSRCAMEALSVGISVARSEDAPLQLLSAIAYLTLGVDVRTDIHRAELEEAANHILSKSAAMARDAGIESVSGTVEWGPSIHKVILEHIDENDIGLVVVGTHGRTGFDRYLVGSVTEYLIRTSPIPVLTVRPPENGPSMNVDASQ